MLLVESFNKTLEQSAPQRFRRAAVGSESLARCCVQALQAGDIIPDIQVLTDEGGESVTMLVCLPLPLCKYIR